MSNNTTSAFLGSPPNTLQDYYIVRGLFRSNGLGDLDPNAGAFFFPPKPPNYVHESKATVVCIGLIIIILSILITTVPRVFLRASKSGMVFGSDDWTIIVAACVSLLYAIMHIMVIVQGGGGQHSWEVTYAQYRVFRIWASFCITAYYVAVGLIKVSITLFLRRIAHQASESWRIFCDIFLASLVVYLLWALLSTTLHCNPIAAAIDIELWGRLEEPPSCMSMLPVPVSLSSIHVAQGTVLLCSPIVMLWKVRMDLGKKIRLFTIWAFGGLTVIGGLLFLLLAKADTDLTWYYPKILTWAAIDICFGLLTASLPIMDAFMVHIWHNTAKKLCYGRHCRAEFRERKSSHSNGRGFDSAISWRRNGGGTAAIASPGTSHMQKSESRENFAYEEPEVSAMELGILRTTDVEVHYSMVTAPASAATNEVHLNTRAHS